MAEYIDKNATVGILEAMSRSTDCECIKKRLEKAAKRVGAIPAADVAPVVRGRWAHLGGDEWCCSACGFVITTEGSWDKPTKKYCEDCGAKMDGKDGGDNNANREVD